VTWTHRRRQSVDVGRQLTLTLLALAGVLAFGTVGYVVLGVPPLDALYGTVFTVTTVGFKEIDGLSTVGILFTIVLMLLGTGTVLYTLTLLMASLVEGRVGSLMGRRRMQREIDGLRGHVIVCGYGRVGKASSYELSRAGRDVVVVDVDPDRLEACPYPTVTGNASSDAVLRLAGVDRAGTLVACLENDADSVYVTLTARALNASLLIIARSRTEDADDKFRRAGADRVVNPQRLGGDRIAAFALQPHVVDFLDVAMHDAGMEFRLEDVEVHAGSALDGSTVRTTREHEGGGALLLALRGADGGFVTNPPLDRSLSPGDVLIVVGTGAQLAALHQAART
jgi:voltage-gated potassium channel